MTDDEPARRPDVRAAGLAVPRALDRADPHRRFTSSRRLGVLFIVAEPLSTPSISVHADLMRFLDPERVKLHVAYPRAALQTAGPSVLDVLPRGPDIDLRAVDFGPDSSAGRSALIGAAARAPVPVARDALALARMIRRERIDVVHCEYGPRNGPYGYLLSHLTPARYIVHMHSPIGAWMNPASRFAIARADAVITVSRWVGRGVQEAGVPAHRIFPIINGIDVEKWDPGVSGTPIRRELGLQTGDPLVVQVAQLVDWKRQRLTIAAFGAVVAKHPSARLLLVGAEPPHTPGHLERLRRQVTDAGLESHVTFAGRRADVAAILAAADVFCLPSVGDPCALAHIEAMAMAKPIVGVDDSGAPELVVDGQTGLLGPADDAPRLAENLLALIEDPERAQAMGKRGRQRAVEYLSAQRMTDDVEAVYRLLAGAESEPVPSDT